MYEFPNLCMDDLIAMLSIAKIVYDETKEVPEALIDSDSFPEIYYEALYNVGEEIGVGENGYDEYVTKYCFPDMLEYYELCKEYGRKQKVAFKRNPFVIEAENFVNAEMNSICSYCIDWRLFAPKTIEKKRYPCLMVTVTPDFYQPVQLVESLYNIRAYYRVGVGRLKSELHKKQPKIISLPKKTEERKKAA